MKVGDRVKVLPDTTGTRSSCGGVVGVITHVEALLASDIAVRFDEPILCGGEEIEKCYFNEDELEVLENEGGR